MTENKGNPTSVRLAWEFIKGVAIALFLVALIPFLAIRNFFDL